MFEMQNSLKTRNSRKHHFLGLLNQAGVGHIMQSTFNEVFLDDMNFLLDFVPNAAQCAQFEVLDIGGHHGYTTLFIQEIIRSMSPGPECRYTIVEADEENIKVLDSLHGKNKNVEIINGICACDKNRPKFVYHAKNNSAGNIYFNDLAELERFKPSWRKKGKVLELSEKSSHVSVSSLIAQKPKVDIMKVDCEGCEYEIFKDLLESDLLNRVQLLLMEVHKTSEDRKELINQLLEFFPYCENLSNDYKMVAFSKRKIGGKYKRRVKYFWQKMIFNR